MREPTIGKITDNRVSTGFLVSILVFSVFIQRTLVMQALTTRQAEILDFIRECVEHTGMAPTRAEVALKFGFRCKTAAADHLRMPNCRAVFSS